MKNDKLDFVGRAAAKKNKEIEAAAAAGAPKGASQLPAGRPGSGGAVSGGGPVMGSAPGML